MFILVLLSFRRQLTEHIDLLMRNKRSVQNQYDLLMEEKQKRLRQKADIETKIRQLRDTRTQLLQRLDESDNANDREVVSVEDLVWHVTLNFAVYRKFLFTENRTGTFENVAHTLRSNSGATEGGDC